MKVGGFKEVAMNKYPEDTGTKFLRNLDNILPDYTAPNLVRQ
jgi:hypothetical protein